MPFKLRRSVPDQSCQSTADVEDLDPAAAVLALLSAEIEPTIWERRGPPANPSSSMARCASRGGCRARAS